VLCVSVYRAYAPHKRAKLMRSLAMLMAWAGFLESFSLTLVQRFVLHAFCTWCLVSAAAATGIFIFVWLDKSVEMGVETSAKELKIVFATLLIGLAAGGTAFHYLIRPIPAKTVDLVLGQGTPEKIYIPPASTSSTPQADVSLDYPIVASSTPIEGPIMAKVTLVEFMDFQCPACGIYHELVIKPLRDKYRGRIRFAVRHFPLADLHPQALGASIAGACAQRQGKFFEYCDLLFENQKDLTRPDLEKYAASLGMDMPGFKSCLEDPAAKSQVIYDYEAGRSFGISNTPTLIINDALIEGAPNLEALAKLVDERL